MNKKIKSVTISILICAFTIFLASCGQLDVYYNSGTDLSISSPEDVSNQDKRELVEVPVLVYNKILPPDHNGIDKQTVTTEQFEADIRYIKEHEYTTIHFQDVIDYRDYGKKLPDKPIIISFDDGYYNNYLYAIPF